MTTTTIKDKQINESIEDIKQKSNMTLDITEKLIEMLKNHMLINQRK